jgi:hypothetical protein
MYFKREKEIDFEIAAAEPFVQDTLATICGSGYIVGILKLLLR